LHQIVHEDPEPIGIYLPTASAELQRIIRKCLAKDREARYQSMKDLAIDLRSLRQELDRAAPDRDAHRNYGVRPKTPWALVLTASVIIVAAIAGWFVWSRLDTKRTAAPM